MLLIILCREHTNWQEPLFDLASTELVCNVGGITPGRQTGIAKLNAGDSMGMGFSVRIFHIGPLFVYMSKAPGDVRDYDGSGDWFKVAELGPVPNAETGIIE